MDAHQVQDIVGNRYHVRRLLGRGGMSTVWLADDATSGVGAHQKLAHALNSEMAALADLLPNGGLQPREEDVRGGIRAGDVGANPAENW